MVKLNGISKAIQTTDTHDSPQTDSVGIYASTYVHNLLQGDIITVNSVRI